MTDHPEQPKPDHDSNAKMATSVIAAVADHLEKEAGNG